MTVRKLPASLLKKAHKELNEDPKRIESDLVAIREWLRKQPHLHLVQNPSDQWLIAFLRGGKYSLEKTKSKLDMYYTLKTIVPEFYRNRDPMDPKIQEILKLGFFLPLKKCEKEDSPRVSIIRVGVFNPSKYHLSDVIKVSLMISEILLHEDDNFMIAGEDVVVDLKNVGVSTLSQWTPALAKKAVQSFEKALPIRVKGSHILNTPIGFETAFILFKSFLGEKLKKRLHVHNQNYKALHKSVSRSLLPSEYGGNGDNVQELIDHWKAKVETYRDWFVTQEDVKSDEEKRPGAPKDTSIVFGVEGSFRKLEFD